MICLLCNSAFYCATSYIISFILRKLSSYFSLNTDSSRTQSYLSLLLSSFYTDININHYGTQTNTRSATCYLIVKT